MRGCCASVAELVDALDLGSTIISLKVIFWSDYG